MARRTGTSRASRSRASACGSAWVTTVEADGAQLTKRGARHPDRRDGRRDRSRIATPAEALTILGYSRPAR
jgi:hypothetical protein